MRFNLYLLYPITHTVLPVDAHVGKALFTDAIVYMLQSHGKTVILVTHALHFLSQCDYIYTVASGRIGEHGTFDDLMARGGEFARLSREFGGEQERKEEEEKEEEGEWAEVLYDYSSEVILQLMALHLALLILFEIQLGPWRLATTSSAKDQSS